MASFKVLLRKLEEAHEAEVALLRCQLQQRNSSEQPDDQSAAGSKAGSGAGSKTELPSPPRPERPSLATANSCSCPPSPVDSQVEDPVLLPNTPAAPPPLQARARAVAAAASSHQSPGIPGADDDLPGMMCSQVSSFSMGDRGGQASMKRHAVENTLKVGQVDEVEVEELDDQQWRDQGKREARMSRVSGLSCAWPSIGEAVKSDIETSYLFKGLGGFGSIQSDLVVQLVFKAWLEHAKSRRMTINFEMDKRWIFAGHSSVHEEGQKCETAFSYDKNMLVQNKVKKQKRGRDWLVHPQNPKRMAWELAGAFMLLYDLIVIPLGSFHMPEYGFLEVMEWVTIIFWTADMLATFLTGYVEHGETVMDFSRIRWRYLRSWFMLDIIIVCPDWLFMMIRLFGAGQSDISASRFLRSLRVVRTTRILRLVKFARVLDRVKDQINSEGMLVVLNVSKLMLGLLGFSHLLASAWYAIGDMMMNANATNWIEAHNLKGEPLHYRYFTAMHWSLTQFTPASIDIQPTNSAERCYALALLLMGLVVFSAFISSITQNMMQLATLHDAKAKQIWLLRKYLRQHGVKGSLFFRILRYLEHKFQVHQTIIPATKVTVLSLLTKQLQEELCYAVSFSCLKCHPLFFALGKYTNIMYSLVFSALSEQHVAMGDLVFANATLASELYCLISGRLWYLMKHDDEEAKEVYTGDWLCEPALWTTWYHLGGASAQGECQLVSMNADSFANCVKKSSFGHKLVCFYASKFLAGLSEIPLCMLSDVMRRRQLSHSRAYVDQDLVLEELTATQAVRQNGVFYGRRGSMFSVVATGEASDPQGKA